MVNRNSARAVRQELESLRRAGVTHLPKSRRSPAAAGSTRPVPPTAVPRPSPAVPARRTTPDLSPAEDPEGRQAALRALDAKVRRCQLCKELAAHRTQTVFGVGNLYPRLVFVGEGPGADEDAQGEPFVGAAGGLLNRIIEACGMRREEVHILNIVKCRPPGNRVPTGVEAANCRPFLDAQLRILKPQFICCLGTTAATNLLGMNVPIGRLRGRVYDYQGAKVVCTYHPAYLLRTPSAKADTWEDMKRLLKEMGLKLPKGGG